MLATGLVIINTNILVISIDNQERIRRSPFSIEVIVHPQEGPQNTRIVLTNERSNTHELPYKLGPDIDISISPRDTPIEVRFVAKSPLQETTNLFLETYRSGLLPVGWHIWRSERHIVSRSIKLWSPDFPNSIFTLGGIGLGILDRTQNSMPFRAPLTMADWDLSRLYGELQEGLNMTLGITTIFNPDGSISQVPDSNPCGGYTLEAVQAKINNTKLLGGYGFKGIVFPKMLIAGRYTTLEWRNGIHFLIYESPISLHFKDMLILSDQVDTTKPDFYPVPHFLPYQYAYKLSFALRNIMKAKYIHGQLHLGNHGYVANQVGNMLISDLETVQSIAGLDNTGNHLSPQEVGKSFELTPYQFAIINELAKPITMMLEEIASHQGLNDNSRIWDIGQGDFPRFALNLCSAFVLGHREQSATSSYPDVNVLESFRRKLQTDFLDYLGYDKFPIDPASFIRSLASFTSYTITQEMYPSKKQRKNARNRM